MANLKMKSIKMIDVQDWDNLVQDTYDRTYNFQQQDGCKDREVVNFTVPSKYAEEMESEMHDEIPEIINGDIMGVKFEKWLERDPKQPVGGKGDQWMIDMWWERNFYPCFDTIINDLYKKGLIEAGDYAIDIDW